MMCNPGRLAPAALANLALAFLACASASRADPPKPSYSVAEVHALTYCVALSDTAFAVAERKLGGATVGDQRAEYAARPRSELTLPLVEKVYADEFKSSWDYALRFFDECAVNVVDLPESRLAGANECLQQGMVASIAHGEKAAGTQKDAVYARFAKLPTEPTRAVIDAVYAQNQERPAAELAAWNACMGRFIRAE